MEVRRSGGASVLRSNLILQIGLGISNMQAGAARPYRDVEVSLGTVDDAIFQRRLSFAAGPPDIVYSVARGEIAMAVINPSAYLSMAYRGTGPFTQALPLRAIAIMPSWDGMGFAVTEKSGLKTLDDVVARRSPLKISLRRNTAHATRIVVDEALAAVGCSLKEVESWGGGLQYVDTPSDPERMSGIADGSLDAVFDEGIKSWGNYALERGMRLLEMGDAATRRFAELGWPMVTLPRSVLPGLHADLPSPSFSGWPLFCNANLPDDVGYAIAGEIDRLRPEVGWDWPDPVQLSDLVGKIEAAPCDVPFHPGAERYYREQGAL
jgi:TRAP-type uncharacterized transport system substrate-binding protein